MKPKKCINCKSENTFYLVQGYFHCKDCDREFYIKPPERKYKEDILSRK